MVRFDHTRPLACMQHASPMRTWLWRRTRVHCGDAGGWMTFAPEWFSGNPNLSNDFIHVSVYLFFMNFVWVLVPFILLVDSSLLLQRAVEAPKRVIANQTAIGNGWYWLIAITLVLYVVLVPLILAVTKG
ncbi:hypothetical protein EON62_04940 [archaeon]|nr:MAG: hypothetical protein EON62_04940 [archaeon]